MIDHTSQKVYQTIPEILRSLKHLKATLYPFNTLKDSPQNPLLSNFPTPIEHLPPVHPQSPSYDPHHVPRGATTHRFSRQLFVTFKTQRCNFLAWSMQPSRNVFRADRVVSSTRRERDGGWLENGKEEEGTQGWVARASTVGRKGVGGGRNGMVRIVRGDRGSGERAKRDGGPPLGTVLAGLRESRRGLCVRRSNARWLNPRKKLEAQSCSAVQPTTVV